MFLHLGKDSAIPCKDIVALLNLNTVNNSEKTKEFLELASVEKRLGNEIDWKEAKSCVLTTDKIYLSTISATTLSKRINFLKEKKKKSIRAHK